jgi:hypothetical protein
MSDEKHRQTIRERAYAIWEQEGRPEDRSLPHWLQAGAEIGPPKHIVGVTDNGKIITRDSPFRAFRASRGAVAGTARRARDEARVD